MSTMRVVPVNVVTWNVLSSGLRGGIFETDPTGLSKHEQELYGYVRDAVYSLFGSGKDYLTKDPHFCTQSPTTIEDILNSPLPDGYGKTGAYKDLIFPEDDDLPVRNQLYRGDSAGFGFPEGGYRKEATEEFKFLDMGPDEQLKAWESMKPCEWALMDRKLYKFLKPFALSQATKFIPERLGNQWLLPADVPKSGVNKVAEIEPGKNGLNLLALRLYDVVMLFARDQAFEKVPNAKEIWNKMREDRSKDSDIDSEIKGTIQVLENFKADLVMLQEIDARWPQAKLWADVEQKYTVIQPEGVMGPDNSYILLLRNGTLGNPNKITLQAGASSRDLVVDLQYGKTTVRVGSLHLTSGGDRGPEPVKKDLETSVFKRLLSRPNITLIGGDMNYDVHKLPMLDGWKLLVTEKWDLLTHAKKLSLLQPQFPKGEVRREGLFDNVYMSDNVELTDYPEAAPEEIVRRIPQRVVGFLPDGDMTLPNKAFGLFGRSDHLPVAFRVNVELDNSQDPRSGMMRSEL